MVRALIGCLRCGYVARKYSFVGEDGRCPECRARMHDVSLSRARLLASSRRKADSRRATAQLASEHDLGPRVMGLAAEDEASSLSWLIEAPAGQGTGDFDHVLLGVAAVDAKGVQLEQLAGVVLVQSTRPTLL